MKDYKLPGAIAAAFQTGRKELVQLDNEPWTIPQQAEIRAFLGELAEEHWKMTQAAVQMRGEVVHTIKSIDGAARRLEEMVNRTAAILLNEPEPRDAPED